MESITYQWKVDFALIISFLALLITSIRWYFESRDKKKKRVLEAYEKVFDDAIFILLHPLKFRKEKARQKEYSNEDPDFEKSVRNYLNSHLLSRSFGAFQKFIPSHIKDQSEQLHYLLKVTEAANDFEREVFNDQLDLDIPSLSPVNYFDNDDIKRRFQSIVDNVGKSLSLFSSNVQRYWSDTLTSDPNEVKKEYQKSLEVCPNYFSHNPRDFSDPYIDLLENIRNDYRKLTRKRIENIGWKTSLYIRKILHPIESYQMYKKIKTFIS